jgi:ABC-2 type transport system ATP-binding protein
LVGGAEVCIAMFGRAMSTIEKSNDEHVISVSNLTKRYGRTLALNDVSLEVSKNEVFALLGPNGAGKTTLMHILSTILQPDSGSATVAGYDVLRQPLRARKNLGIVFQEPSLDDRLTVQENLDFHGLVFQVPFSKRRQRIDEMLELVELTEWRDSVVRSLSSGMKRRLEIARALVHDSKVIFLDEPTVGLDAQSRARIWSYLSDLKRSRDLTVVVTTHYIEEVENCDRVCVIDHGRILASGTPSALKAEHGRMVMRVTPRDENGAAAITAAFPGAKSGPAGELILPLASEEGADAFLHGFGSTVRKFAVETPSLESVFLNLTGRDIRDKAADGRDQLKSAGQRGGARR